MSAPAATLAAWIPIRRPAPRTRRRPRARRGHRLLVVRARRQTDRGSRSRRPRGAARGGRRRDPAAGGGCARRRRRAARERSGLARRAARAARRRPQEQYRELMDRVDASRRAQARRRKRAESKVLQALAPVQGDAEHDAAEGHRARDPAQLSSTASSASSCAAPTESEERLRSTAESLASAPCATTRPAGCGARPSCARVVEVGRAARTASTSTCSRRINVEPAPAAPTWSSDLPGGKIIAVDAKVPYNSYLEASAIPADRDRRAGGAGATTLLAQHAKQVKRHIDALGAQDLLGRARRPAPSSPSPSSRASRCWPRRSRADPALMEFAFSQADRARLPGHACGRC